jgi:hypothetical protein
VKTLCVPNLKSFNILFSELPSHKSFQLSSKTPKPKTPKPKTPKPKTPKPKTPKLQNSKTPKPWCVFRKRRTHSKV